MTLIEKYGMVRSARVIQDFYDDVARDPQLAAFFEDVSISDLAEHQADVLVMVMGGAISHTHRQIQHAHGGMEISNEQFDVLLVHLEHRLLGHGFDPADVEQIIGSYRAYQPFVTGAT